MLARLRRSSAALALIVAACACVSAEARAAGGPGCEAGAPCADLDHDGYVACACAAPGVACDCDDTDPTAFPGAPERCDSPKDQNCDGVVRASCGEKMGCLGGMCVQECVPLDDFGCGIGNRCESQPNGQRLCAGPDCTAFGCLPGFTCDDTKVCVADCTPNVKCPQGQLCRGTNCSDPCDGVVCGAGSSCRAGQCVASCDCSPGSMGCAAGETCDRALAVPRCVESSCAGVVCASGSHCAGGTCVDDCAGVVCPPKRVCQHVTKGDGTSRGECVDLCPPGTCLVPLVCNWRTGACDQPKYPEAGLEPVDVGGDDDVLLAAGAGITCTTNGLARASATGGLAAVLSFGILLVRRRARRRRGR
jgi:hypothetical protein